MNEAAQKESEASTPAKTAANTMQWAEKAMVAAKEARFAVEKAAKQQEEI